MWRKMWQKNVGRLDRGIRLGGGALLIGAGLFLLNGLEASVLGIVVAALGLWFVFTGAIGRCPLYVLLGISTLREEKGAEAPGSGPLEPSVYPPSSDGPPEGLEQPQRGAVGTRR